MLKTPLCERVGIECPIFSVGMGGGMAGPRLVSAVSNAGGCGVLGLGGVPANHTRQQIREVRAMTKRVYGVNIILPLLQEGQIETCLDESVPLIIFFWGSPEPYVAEAHSHGVKVLVQVGTVEEAVMAAEAGVDAIIVQGAEAGGHVRGHISLSTFLPVVVDAVNPIPVIASGGIANGRGLAAALACGAQAVSLGTRFLASAEACAHNEYKRRIVTSNSKDTVRTTLFDVGWPSADHRVLRNRALTDWEKAGRPRPGERPGEGRSIGTMQMAEKVISVPKYSVFPPRESFVGDVENMVLYAGESCGLIHDIKPAEQIVREISAGAETTLKKLPALYL